VHYLDTSALAKLTFAERESAVLTSFIGAGDIAASALSRTELRRAAHRRDPAYLPACDQLLSRCHEVPMTAELLDRAGEVRPSHLRSLDAIHLVSALALQPALADFIAYDRRLCEAAELAGLPVVSPR